MLSKILKAVPLVALSFAAIAGAAFVGSMACSDPGAPQGVTPEPLATVAQAQSGCGDAGASNCPSTALGIYNVCTNATGGAGTSTCPWTGWESALNSVPLNTADGGNGYSGGSKEIYFPAGYYAQASQIVLQPGWSVRGAGMDATVIEITFSTAQDAFHYSSIGNSWANIRIEDLQITANGNRIDAGAIDDINGAYFYLTRVFTNGTQTADGGAIGFNYGVIFDGAEQAHIDESIIDNAMTGGVLFKYEPTGPNAVSVHKTQFNGSPIGILDNGGNNQVIDNNSFWGGAPAIRMGGANNVIISGNEIEATSVAIDSTSAANSNLTITNNQLSTGSNTHAITLGSDYQVLLTNNSIVTSASDGGIPPVAVTGLGNVNQFTAFSNSLAVNEVLTDGNPSTGYIENSIPGEFSTTFSVIGLDNSTLSVASATGDAGVSVTAANNATLSVVGTNGSYVGVGTSAPKSTLHLAGGNAYLSTPDAGVILTNGTGACFLLGVTNSGTLATTSVTCP